MLHWRVRKALYFTLSAGSWVAIVTSNGNWLFVIAFLGLLMAGLNVEKPDRWATADGEPAKCDCKSCSEREHYCLDDEMEWNDILLKYEWVCPHSETSI